MSRLSRYCDGVMEAAWLLALIATPLFFNLDSKRPFDVEKVALMRTIIWFAFAVWLVKLISEGGLRFVNIPLPTSLKAFLRMPLVLPIALLVFSYLISTLFSVAPRVSLFGSYERMDGFLTRISYLLFFVVIAVNLRRREQIERLLTITILTSLPVSLYAILQHYDLDPYGWAKKGVKRSVSTIDHPIFTSAFLSMSLIMTNISDKPLMNNGDFLHGWQVYPI